MVKSELLASSLKNSAVAGFDAMVAERFRQLDLSGLFFSNMQTVSPVLFPLLAEQLDVAGYGGYLLLSGAVQDSEALTRGLLTKAIQLHRKKGTPWAIREALRAVGFPDCTIVEGEENATPITYNGVTLHDGATQYGGSSWAVFRVVIDLGNSKGVSPAGLVSLRGMVEEYKPARSRLLDVTFNATLAEVLPVGETFAFGLERATDSEVISSGIKYDGANNYDGALASGGAGEIFTMQIHRVG